VCSLLRLGAGHRGDACEGNEYDIGFDVGNKKE
jgi:hypothetical protein